MKPELITPITNIIVILGSLLSIMFTFGIVWRVEKKLDTAYKFFLASLMFFTLSEILSMIELNNEALSIIISGMKIIFILLLLGGILEMRQLIRTLDGEISENAK